MYVRDTSRYTYNLQVPSCSLPPASSRSKFAYCSTAMVAIKSHSPSSMVAFAAAMVSTVSAIPASVPQAGSTHNLKPFAPIDPQNWVNPDNMTWDDFVAPPSTSWSDPSRKGRSRNFNIAMVTVDYPGTFAACGKHEQCFDARISIIAPLVEAI
jgi:hypothetical protein